MVSCKFVATNCTICCNTFCACQMVKETTLGCKSLDSKKSHLNAKIKSSLISLTESHIACRCRKCEV